MSSSDSTQAQIPNGGLVTYQCLPSLSRILYQIAQFSPKMRLSESLFLREIIQAHYHRSLRFIAKCQEIFVFVLFGFLYARERKKNESIENQSVKT